MTFSCLIPAAPHSAARRPAPGSKGVAAVATAAIVIGSALVGGAGFAAALPRSAPTFAPIREVFDGNRVARPRPAGAVCHTATTTYQLEICNEDLTENVDVEIDGVRQKQFAAASSDAARLAINADDAAWLANRGVVCAVSYPAQGSGTIRGIEVSARETEVSVARLAAVQGRAVPVAHLVATDNPDPHATQYATTGTGVLIGAIDTQGDATGGAVIAWVVIGGYKGFTVRTGGFTFVDGTFTDAGIVLGHPGGHHVGVGKEYAFDIDYSRLGHDPHRDKGTGRYEYRSGANLVGSWS